MASSQAEIYKEIQYFEKLIEENEQLIRKDTAYFDHVGWNQASPGQMDGMRNKIYEWQDHINELKARLRAIEYEESLSPEQKTLERLRRHSSLLEQFIKRTNCAWSEQDWLGLLDELRRSGFVPFDAAEVRKFLEQQTKQKLNDSEKRASQALTNAEKKLQALSSQRIQEFAPNEIQLAQSNFAQAKQLFQAGSFFNCEESAKLSEMAMRHAQNAEEITKQALAGLRKPFEEVLGKRESELHRKISSIRSKYDEEINQLKERKRQSESTLSKHGKPGCGLWVLAWLVGAGLWVVWGKSLLSKGQDIEGSGPVMLSYAVAVLLAYGALRLIREIPKMSAESSISQAEQRIKEVTDAKEKEKDELLSRFIHDPEVIKSKSALENLKG